MIAAIVHLIITDRGVNMGNGQQSNMVKIRQEGFDEGLAKGRHEILDWLEHAYIDDPGRPDRGTPKAEAILELAQAARQHFITKTNGRTNGRKRGARR
jgi:hypothetical protein